MHESYIIAHLRSKAGGRQLHLVRPMMLFTSSGLSFSCSRADGGIYQDARGAEFLRGGTFERRVDDSGAIRLTGSSGFWSGGVPLQVDVTLGERFEWLDSGHVELHGRSIGPSMQTYVASRERHGGTGVCHTGTFYEGGGTVFGEAVEGILVVEHVFSPPDKILADSSIRRRFAGGWNGFATVFEDGGTQHGHIAYGAGPFRFANIIDGDRHIASAIKSVRTETDAHGLGRRAEYHLANGEVWEFVTETTYMDFLALARAAGSTTQCHKGYVQRAGETRRRKAWYSIQEWVPERLRDGAAEAQDILPRGF
jgi:hypothetical protein